MLVAPSGKMHPIFEMFATTAVGGVRRRSSAVPKCQATESPTTRTRGVVEGVVRAVRTPTAKRRLAADALGGWVAPLVTTTTRTTSTTVVAGIATAHCRALPAPRRIGISSRRYDAI